MFKSQYELVTFSLEPYSFAQAQGKINDAILDEIISRNIPVTPGNKEIEEILTRNR